MQIIKTNPVGMDAPLQDLQAVIHDGLVGDNGLWVDKISADQYRSFGRCYRNISTNGYIAEWYEGNNNYKEVYVDSQFPVQSFFGSGQKVSRQGTMEIVEIHYVFFV